MINNFDDSILNAYQLSYNYSFSELSFIEYDEFFKRFLYREYNISFHDFNLSKLTGRISPMDIVPEGLFGNLYYIGQDIPLQEGKSDRFINITLTNGNLNVIAGDIYGGWGGWGLSPLCQLHSLYQLFLPGPAGALPRRQQSADKLGQIFPPG